MDCVGECKEVKCNHHSGFRVTCLCGQVDCCNECFEWGQRMGLIPKPEGFSTIDKQMKLTLGKFRKSKEVEDDE